MLPVAPAASAAGPVITSELAVVAVMLKAFVATPATALIVAVPDSAPPLGFAPIATVTGAELPVTVLPPISWTTNTGDVLSGAFEFEFDGLACTARCDAAPTVTLNALLVADVSAPLVADNW